MGLHVHVPAHGAKMGWGGGTHDIQRVVSCRVRGTVSGRCDLKGSGSRGPAWPGEQEASPAIPPLHALEILPSPPAVSHAYRRVVSGESLQKPRFTWMLARVEFQ